MQFGDVTIGIFIEDVDVAGTIDLQTQLKFVTRGKRTASQRVFKGAIRFLQAYEICRSDR